jgi:hypothetical protein
MKFEKGDIIHYPNAGTFSKTEYEITQVCKDGSYDLRLSKSGVNSDIVGDFFPHIQLCTDSSRYSYAKVLRRKKSKGHPLTKIFS